MQGEVGLVGSGFEHLIILSTITFVPHCEGQQETLRDEKKSNQKELTTQMSPRSGSSQSLPFDPSKYT